ncbi:MAG: PH domain-containing protein [Bacteroidetes bacterium]|nr:PH domain-containing protein [Bacteroidota bacterium]
MSGNVIIKEAKFDDAVKTYIFFVVLFFLIITFIGILFLPFWIFGLGHWLSNKYFHTLKCQLSSKNLKFSKGLILRIEKTIPLENIQDLSFIGGPILRAFGLTLIRVETAGGGGKHNSSMMSMIGIIDAEDFKDLILVQREIVIKEKSQGYSVRPETAVGNNENLLQDIKTELIMIKQILQSKSQI